MTSSDLRSLLAAATPGEWVAIETGSSKYMAWIAVGTAKNKDNVALVDNHKIEIASSDVDESNANANLIATIHNELPALLDRLEASEARVQKLEAALRGLYEQLDSLEDFKFSRDLSPSEAQMNWDDARLAARRALEE